MALIMIKCSECGREISDKAQTCPGCGAPVAVTAADAAPPTPQPAPTAPQQSSAAKTGCLGCLGVLGLVFFVAMLFSLFGGSNSSPSAPRDRSTMAAIQCENYVRDRLRAPSTADFPFLDRQTSALGNETYLVRSYVDAQNAFGATIRTNWVCRIRYTGGEDADQRNWTLVDLQMEP